MSETKTHYKNPKDQHYMGAYSFPNMQDLVLTIQEVVKEDVALPTTGEIKERNVCYFTESSDLIKPLIVKDTTGRHWRKWQDRHSLRIGPG